MGRGFAAPDSIGAGWHRLRFSQAPEGRGQNLVVFAIPDTTDAPGWIRALDTAGVTPLPAVARGGSESPVRPGDTTNLLIRLDRGRYLFASMTRDTTGHRHSAQGVWKELWVVPGTAVETGPLLTDTLRMVDFAYPVAATWRPGRRTVLVTNDGRQDHLVLVERMVGNHTLRDRMVDEDETTSTRVAGVPRLGPGQSIVLELDLAPGRYLLSCLILDPATGRTHVELGMIRLITVVPPGD